MSNQRDTILNQVISCVLKKQPKQLKAPLRDFVQAYYQHVALHDLTTHSVESLAGIVQDLWSLRSERGTQAYQLRIAHPTVEQQGWTSPYTVIQLNGIDMPFMVSSVCLAIHRLQLHHHFLVNLGGFVVQAPVKEAFIHIEVDRIHDPKQVDVLYQEIMDALEDVAKAVHDWQAMRAQAQKAVQVLSQLSTEHLDVDDIHESQDFLRWLLDDNFTFLGYRYYQVSGTGAQRGLTLLSDAGLGVFRGTQGSKQVRYYCELSEQALALSLSRQILNIAKTNTRSTVHRSAYTDYISVKCFDDGGNIKGEHRFLGLFTSDVYGSDPEKTPIVRRKLKQILAQAHFSEGGYAERRLKHILRTLPLDDLFQGSAQELFEVSLGVLQLHERRVLKLFVRVDAYRHFVSCFVYVPREKFNTSLRMRMQTILVEAFEGIDSGFTPYFSESVLTRVHYMIRIDPQKPVDYDVNAIEALLIDAASSWQDHLYEALVKTGDTHCVDAWFHQYKHAFPKGYQEAFGARSAVRDIQRLEEAKSRGALVVSFYQTQADHPQDISMKLFRMDSLVLLSDVMPILEHMLLNVFSENAYHIVLPHGQTGWISHFKMQATGHIDMPAIKQNLQEAFLKISAGEIENDGFNALLLSASLTHKEINVLRAYAKYLRQTGVTFSQQYIEETLNGYPNIARQLVQLFTLRFQPNTPRDRETQSKKRVKAIHAAIDGVSHLDADTILNRYLDLIMATLRTNYFQDTGCVTLSFKFDSTKVPDLPLPAPKYECFVYSPFFEGIHLRAGDIARGGIRWSDRKEDFRTEVLGLMKAQQVKNALIVPTGAKGGFVLKRPMLHASRHEIMEEAIQCYRQFIGGLLDITDNLVDDHVVKPKDTVCYDHDDPYFVVAADKGTATFSDTANAIAKERGFWLGDAFASGGSAGYDHKKMGITARGAWESVKRHCYELGMDIQKHPFTVVGIGDMSGDVFGNGMLLSKQIKLVAAFNHMHIFLDPDPDPEISHAERARLFSLPSSTWADYDAALISKGGGVYSRQAKSIKLSTQMQKILNIKTSVFKPNALIQALLRAPVDLLWNGGIGTYIKSSQERHQDVGDVGNNGVRVDANTLCCRVVAEGGNLGVTQLGRIEYALHGGRINTDFIDNVSGVDCSDHEVNSKILLNQWVHQGKMGLKKRNQWLRDMTPHVAALVLHNNYRQNILLSLSMQQLPAYLNVYERYMNDTCRSGQLNRALEFLPDEDSLNKRKATNSKGLTRPELAILLAYSKNLLKKQILDSDILSDSYFDRYIETAFPEPIAQACHKLMKSHRLRRQIGATQLSNALVSDMGIVFVHQMQDELGADIESIIRAYIIAKALFDFDGIFTQLCALEYQIPAQTQMDMMLDVIRLIRRATRWFLYESYDMRDISKTVTRFSQSFDQLNALLPDFLSAHTIAQVRSKEKALLKAPIPADLAQKIARIKMVYPTLNIIALSHKHHLALSDTVQIYFRLSDTLQLTWLREQIGAYPVDSKWRLLARSAFRADLDRYQKELTVSIARMPGQFDDIHSRVTHWFAERALMIQRWQSILFTLKSQGTTDFAMFTLLLRELYQLSRS